MTQHINNQSVTTGPNHQGILTLMLSQQALAHEQITDKDILELEETHLNQYGSPDLSSQECTPEKADLMARNNVR